MNLSRSGAGLSQTAPHAHPMYDYLTGFLPTRLKDLFRWCEYLYYRSPQIFSAGQRLAEYAITDVVIKTDSEQEREQYEDLLNTHIGIKEVLKTAARDRLTYGNGFYSVLFPTKKLVHCKPCGMDQDLARIRSAKFVMKTKVFEHTCPKCGHLSRTPLDDVREIKTFDKTKIRVVAWDPKLIDIQYNPITGNSRYYYNIPSIVRAEVQRGDMWYITQLPMSILKAIASNQLFRFADASIYHIQTRGPSGLQSGWGLPPLASVMKDFFYAGTLRRANEAIALEHTTPFRVLSPDLGGGGSLIRYLSLSDWRNNVSGEIKEWRRDPLHIMLAPIPLGVTQMGGQGRALMLTAEVEQSENNIMAGLGVPREFIYGGLQFTGSAVILRMLENQLISDIKGIKGLLTWIVDRIRGHMNWPRVSADILPFKFVDDVAQKGMLLQADSVYDFLSKTTVAEQFGISVRDEAEKRRQEQMEGMEQQRQIETQRRSQEGNIYFQSQQSAAESAGALPDEAPFHAAAQEFAASLAGQDQGMVQSQLHTLRGQSPVIYALVVQLLEDQNRQQTMQAKQMVREGAV